mgnify:CR=1 FL=1
MDRSPLQIVTYPNPTLRMKAEAVRRFDGDLVRLVDGMFAVMRRAGGCGLAAVQVGLPVRVLIGVDLSGRELILVNPVVTDRQGWAEAEENCLSVPCVSGRVGRASRVSPISSKARIERPTFFLSTSKRVIVALTCCPTEMASEGCEIRRVQISEM